ncbi:uncharacterized protein LOC114788457 isoform X2 [Denticeps clupeoides]|uniref:uncharacterized protein LOC114788457 isoform X2 n=1 Tax=Denticeps clupeoides TaxID=299321 RepID=UPI0010A2F532|nr:uncharacterized protein LOC114788457 isoform X2 [Denticeps clupeoides]
MGSTNSRPKICQVAPSHVEIDGNLKPSYPNSEWMLSPMDRTHEQLQEVLGPQRNTKLPPLRQDVLLHSNLHASGALPLVSTDIKSQSIIHSHPPLRAQAWQPLISPTGQKDASSHKPTSSSTGFLEAQAMLSHQAKKKRRGHHQRYRERRGMQRASEIMGHEGQEIQKLSLVSRPTKRDIFWDETTGKTLDIRELLQPSPVSSGPEWDDYQTQSQPKDRRNVDDFLGNQKQIPNDSGDHETNSTEHKATPWNPKTTLPWMQDWRVQGQNKTPAGNDIDSADVWNWDVWQGTQSRRKEWKQTEQEFGTRIWGSQQGK